MGVSSKKKGQQRKAAKRALSAAEGASSSNVGSVSDAGNDINSKIIAKIRSGDNKVTKRLHSGLSRSREEIIPLVSSGALSIVLEFLNRCENETFERVMASVGGDLKTPSLWINVLVSASFNKPSCKLQIVPNIGPLVRCMVNDTDRLLFKSNKHWRQGIVPFVNMVLNIMEDDANNSLENGNIIETMLQYDGFLTLFIQMGFWEEYRPDIVKDLKSEGITTSGIVSISMGIIEMLVNEMDLFLEEESRIRLLQTIGTTPIVNKEYDPSCMVSYTAGLALRLKTSGEDQIDDLFAIIQRLVREADCVDKGVIIELVDLGTNYTLDYESASNVGILSLAMIHESSCLTKAIVNDTRVTCATRAGLIEMCLGFIERFSEHESFGNGSLSMYNFISCTFQSIGKVSLHKKTAKAIKHQRGSIEEKLLRLEGDEDMSKELLDMVNFCSKIGITNNTSTSSNPKKMKLLDMVRQIINLSGSYCCRCNKALSKTEVKECNGCGRMAYCSLACQREDWLDGHKLSCCKTYTDESIGQFQGRLWPKSITECPQIANKFKELEININMIQLKLLLDNSDAILRQARALDIPLHDCVAKFDLRDFPLKNETVHYTKVYHDTPEMRKGFEESRSKKNITCTYCFYFYNRDEKVRIAMQRFFPLEWLLMKQSK